MKREEYKELDSLIRRIERLKKEEYEVWTAVANRLVNAEIKRLEAVLAASFDKKSIQNVRLMASRVEHIKDRYKNHRWVWYQVHNKVGYHDEEMIRRVKNKLSDYHFFVVRTEGI